MSVNKWGTATISRRYHDQNLSRPIFFDLPGWNLSKLSSGGRGCKCTAHWPYCPTLLPKTMTATAAKHNSIHLRVVRFFYSSTQLILQPSRFSDLTDTTLETKKITKIWRRQYWPFSPVLCKNPKQQAGSNFYLPERKETVQDLAL